MFIITHDPTHSVQCLVLYTGEAFAVRVVAQLWPRSLSDFCRHSLSALSCLPCLSCCSSLLCCHVSNTLATH